MVMERAGRSRRCRVRAAAKDVIYEGLIHSIKRFQDEANECARRTWECGNSHGWFPRITRSAEQIECYHTEKVDQETLSYALSRRHNGVRELLIRTLGNHPVANCR